MESIAFRTAAAALLATVLPLTASATTNSAQDQTFTMKAAQAGMTEVKLAAVAMQRSKNPAVLSFARSMNADHTKANKQLSSLAQAKGLRIPSDVGPVNTALMAKMQGRSGATFDRLYLKSQLPAHQQVLALFQAEAKSGSDPDLVAFAKQTIPVIQSHIAMDQRDTAQLGSGSMSMSGTK